MNKKDISAIKKEFKPESTLLSIKQVYSVYLKSENKSILHKESAYFGQKEEDEQDIYLKNFKKILTGGMDSKIFEMNFKSSDDANEGQNLFFSLLDKSDSMDVFKEYCDKVIQKITDSVRYETDVVISFIRATYHKVTKKKKKKDLDLADLEGYDDKTHKFDFIMCSINKVDPMKKTLKFDYTKKEFQTTSSLDTIINMSSPLDGFMFPAFNDNASDVNKIVYYTSKADRRNEDFIVNILNCEYALTAKEEKEKFDNILKAVTGDKIKPAIMKNIYEKITHIIESNDSSEPVVMGKKDIKRVLENSGIEDTSKLENVYEDLVNDVYKFKATNIAPNYNSKSIKIESSIVNIAISPKDLSAVKQVLDNRGKKCLLIEVDEDIEINGIPLTLEKL